MADVRLTVETSRLNDAFRRMERTLSRSGVSQKRIIDFEVGKIMEGAMKRTNVASKSELRADFEAKEWTTYGGKRYKLSNRYPNPLWRAIDGKRKAGLARRLAAIGTAKQTWVLIAGKLGIRLDAPGYVFSARLPTRSNEANVSVTQQVSETAYGVGVVNSSPLMKFANGRQALFSAIIGRRKFFERNVSKGVFDEIATIARAYPGLVVTQK